MRAQIILNVNGAKHLIAASLVKKIDFSKRIYIAYGSTNEYLLYHLGIKFDLPYIAGFFGDNKLNVTKNRPKIVVLDNKKLIDVSDFEITSEDYFIKGANALWYENNKKCAAVAAADSKGGTFGNFYIKAACAGSKVIIPVGFEKLIPFFNKTSQNVDISMGNKIAMLRFFYGEIYTEIEAFKDLFNAKAKILASGGICGYEGSVIFEVESENIEKIVAFCEKHNTLTIR